MPDEKITIEIWKKVVDVQQHFNDLELRIRNYALIVTGAFLAFAGTAIKDQVQVFGGDVSVGSLIVVAAIAPLLAFYFMDKYWYHRLLDGAVRAGATVEAELRSLGYSVDLGEKISAASPIVNRFYGMKVEGDKGMLPMRRMHSRHKMDVFYGILFLSLILISITITVGLRPAGIGAKADGPPSSNISDGTP